MTSIPPLFHPPTHFYSYSPTNTIPIPINTIPPGPHPHSHHSRPSASTASNAAKRAHAPPWLLQFGCVLRSLSPSAATHTPLTAALQPVQGTRFQRSIQLRRLGLHTPRTHTCAWLLVSARSLHGSRSISSSSYATASCFFRDAIRARDAPADPDHAQTGSSLHPVCTQLHRLAHRQPAVTAPSSPSAVPHGPSPDPQHGVRHDTRDPIHTYSVQQDIAERVAVRTSRTFRLQLGLLPLQRVRSPRPPAQR